MAVDLPTTTTRVRRCRVTVCPGTGDTPPAPAQGWRWVPASTAVAAPDSIFAAHAIAATQSFCPAATPPPLPHQPAPAAAPMTTDPRLAMAAVAARLRAALAASSPYAQSWVDVVGRLDDAVLASTTPALSTRDPCTRDPRLRLQRFSPRYAAPHTEPYAFPANGIPPPSFQPTCTADLFAPEAWDRVVAWYARHWSYLLACWRDGAEARRGDIPTLVLTQLDLQPPARGVVWDTSGPVPVPVNFEAPLMSHLDTAFLAAALRDYADQELVSFVTKGAASKTQERSLVMVLSPHLTSLGAGVGPVNKAITSFVDKGWYDSLNVLVPRVPCNNIPQGQCDKKDGDKRRTSDFGAPRKPTVPPVVSMNVLAKSKVWVPEVKPTLKEQANDLAVLRYAADLWEEDLVLISDDIKFYFNQLRLHPSEVHKSCFMWFELIAGEPVPAWVVEYVLGFGMSPSSNIAQRFAHALLWILRRRFDAEEAELFAQETDPERRAYLQERTKMGAEQCALYLAEIFTDDSEFIIVGVERAARFLTAWGKLIDEVRLIMAGPAKRMAGSTFKWNGVYTNAFLCNQILPIEKALRTVQAINDLNDPASVAPPFREYRKLTGRIEDFRGILQLKRRSTYGLYAPHKAFAHRHPEGAIHRTPLLLARSLEWHSRLLSTAGRSCGPTPPPNSNFAPYDPAAALRCLFAYTDAALTGAPVPGLGGFLHGFFFSYALPFDMLGYAIPQLEFLAIIAATLVFRAMLVGALAVLVTDSMTSALVLNNDGAHNDEMQWLHLELLRITGDAPVFAEHRHGHGETNPCGDLPSRGRLVEFYELCAQLNITPHRLQLPREFEDVLSRFRAQFGPKFAALGSATRPPPIAAPHAPTPPTPLSPHAPTFDPVAHAAPTPDDDADDSDDGWTCLDGDTVPMPVLPPSGASPSTHPPPPPAPPSSGTGCFRVTYNPPPARPPTPRPLPTPPPPRDMLLPPPHTRRLIHYAAVPKARPHTLQPPRRTPPSIYAYAPRPTQPSIYAPPRPPFARPNALPTAAPPAGPLASHARPAGKPPTPTPTPPPPQPRFRVAPRGTEAAQRDAFRRNQGVQALPEGASYDFDAEASPLADLFRSIGNVMDAGIPDGTLKVDNLAWRRWSEFVDILKTPAWRLDRQAHSGADPAGFDRESMLLCAFLIWCYDIIQPRSKNDPAPKPQSCYNMVSGVRRIHRRANVDMVSCQQLSAVMKGITAQHIIEHGAESLLPERKEPIGPVLLRALLSLPDGTVLGKKTLNWADPLFLCLGAMFALGGGTGFRKAEVALPGGTTFNDRRVRRASLLWEIDGAVYADPSPAQLRGLVPLRDKAIIKPPRSKGDQDGTKFGAHPIYQIYDPADIANAAAWLLRIELRFPRRGAYRLITPLFFSEARKYTCISHSTVDTYLAHLLHYVVPHDKVTCYSFHSFRIGFACALLAAGCPYDMIQALARWRSAESVKIYARINPSDYTTWVSQALLQDTTSHTTARLPVIDAQGIAAAFGLATDLSAEAA